MKMTICKNISEGVHTTHSVENQVFHFFFNSTRIYELMSSYHGLRSSLIVPGPAYVKLTLRGIVNVANKFLDKMFHHNILSAK